jgi:hypothetical protein
VPADTGAWRILRDENLLKAAGRVFRKGFRARAKPDQHVVRLREAAAVEIVAPAKRYSPALTGKAVKLESLNGRLSALCRRVCSSPALRKSA